MLRKVFTSSSPYTKRARTLAILWTLLIFILCFIPGKEFPDVNIPLADKWVHFLLFGIFSFLWLCAKPTLKLSRFVIVFLAGVALGWIVEELQGLLISLGRSKSVGDIYADALGSLLGVLLFAAIARVINKGG